MIDKEKLKQLEEKNIQFVSEVIYNEKNYIKAVKVLKKRNRIYIL